MTDITGDPPETLAPEGGFVALVGYLQQMLGGAQDYVQWLQPKRGTRDGGFQALLTFEHEVYGQDFADVAADASGRRTRTLTQYKFSLHPEANTIPPAELDEIVDTLLQSQQEANRVEALPTRLVLRSNRPLSPKSQLLVAAAEDAAKGGVPSALLATKTTRKKVRKKWVVKQVPREPRDVAALAALKYKPFDPKQARADLEAQAREFGLYTTAELDDGVRRVIDLLFTAATTHGSRRVRRDQFEEALVGLRGPRRLTIDELAPRLSQDLEGRTATLLGVEPPRFRVRREAADELDALADDALVVLAGHGGCGKTVVLWEAVRGAARAAGPLRKLAAVVTEADHRGDLHGLVASWRTGSDAPRAVDPEHVAVERLVRANPATPPPVLVLGLDGIDEASYDRDWVTKARRLLQFFWGLQQNRAGPPPARLLVTCRTIDDVERFIGGHGGHGLRGGGLRQITVGDFTDTEMISLCQQTPGLDPGVADSLMRAVSAAAATAPGAAAAAADPYSAETVGPASGGSVPAEVTEALGMVRHPIVWHCFAGMGAEAQAAVLAGAPPALDSLAGCCLDWFLRRAESRRGWDRHEVRTVLRAVARHTADGNASRTTGDWHEPCRAVGWSEVRAGGLFREAVSSGLIDEAAPAGGGSAGSLRAWRWRHVLVWRYLCGI